MCEFPYKCVCVYHYVGVRVSVCACTPICALIWLHVCECSLENRCPSQGRYPRNAYGYICHFTAVFIIGSLSDTVAGRSGAPKSVFICIVIQ